MSLFCNPIHVHGSKHGTLHTNSTPLRPEAAPAKQKSIVYDDMTDEMNDERSLRTFGRGDAPAPAGCARLHWGAGLSNARGGREGLGHKLAAAWVRVRAAFGDGWLCTPRDDPKGSSAAGSSHCSPSIYLSIYRSAAAACPSGERATHTSAACSAAAKLPRWTSLPPRFTRA